MEWREKNPGKLKVIQSRYRKKQGSASNDFREEKIEVLPFKERVSPETLLRMKENTLINQKHIKKYILEDESVYVFLRRYRAENSYKNIKEGV